MATTDKIITLSGLTAYNTAITTALGLSAGAAYSKNAAVNENPTKVSDALNDLYAKVAEINAKNVTLTAGTNTNLTAGDVVITLGGDGAAEGQTVTLSKIEVPITATASTGSNYVSVGLTDGVLTVADTIEDTFLKKTDVSGVTLNDVTLSKSGETNTYAGVMNYTDNKGESKSVTISFNSADFVKDAFLDSVTVGEGDDAGKLVFTWNSDSGKEVTKITIADFIKAYTEGNGIDISDNNKISAVAKEGDYVTVGTDGIQLDSDKIETSTDSKYNNTKLATAAYVDEKTAAVTGGTSTSNFVKVDIESASAAPTVTTTVADSNKYTATGLATDAYVKAATKVKNGTLSFDNASDATGLVSVDTDTDDNGAQAVNVTLPIATQDEVKAIINGNA